jgi:sulfite exporter TauE/SafE
LGEVTITFGSAFLLGFLGSGHCLGMCGGLAGALGLSTFPAGARLPEFDYRRFFTLCAYNLGRITSYGLAGLLIGMFGLWLGRYFQLLEVLRYVAAIILILLGLFIGQWFNALVMVERAGTSIWRKIEPLGRRFMPPQNMMQAFCLGMVWGWLPCGLVYSALIWASARAHPVDSALLMLCFGLGTLPSMLLTSLFARHALQTLKSTWFRKSAGVLLIVFGLWSLPVLQQMLFAILKRI